MVIFINMFMKLIFHCGSREKFTKFFIMLNQLPEIEFFGKRENILLKFVSLFINSVFAGFVTI